jgi:hypothetical protein
LSRDCFASLAMTSEDLLSLRAVPRMSFRAQREILRRTRRFLSRSLSHPFEAGSFEMTMSRIPSQTKRFFHDGFPYPRRCRGLLSTAPQERGSKPPSSQRDAHNVVGASGCSPFFPGICCTVFDSSLCAFPINVISSAARNLAPNAKISQSQPLASVRGWLLRNDKAAADAASPPGLASTNRFGKPSS